MISNITAVASVSAKRGLVYLKILDEGVNGENFVPYINQLSNKMDYKPFCLFMDNLRVHKMNVVKEACKDARITRVWNIAHCPQFNCK